MHTETHTPRVEAFIRTHRARISYALMATLAVLLYVAWHVVSRGVQVQSPTLDACVFALSTMGSAIAALAFYWSAE